MMSSIPNRIRPLRACTLTLAAGLGLALWQPPAGAQNARDFVFTDEEGHLVLRFAGTSAEAGADGLTTRQIDEIVNVQLSTMVHDRLRADAEFEAEPVDARWANEMEPQIENYLSGIQADLSSVSAECRSASCRVVLDHTRIWNVAAHQSVMSAVQQAVEAFIDENPSRFEPVFLMAGHYQEPEIPYLKVFLQRCPAR